MNWSNFPSRQVLFLLEVMILATACNYRLPNVTSKPVVTLPSEFISVITTQPKQGSTIPAQLFWSLQGFNNTIAMKWDPYGLANTGEDLDLNLALQRTVLSIDGKEAPLLGALDEVLLRIDEDNNSTVSGPFTFCWKTQLQPGKHSVMLHYQKNVNEFATYYWDFTILEEQVEGEMNYEIPSQLLWELCNL